MPGNGGRHRHRAGSEHQLVIGGNRDVAARHIAQPDLLRSWQDLHGLAVSPDVDREIVAEELLAGDEQVRLPLDHSADVVGQPAVREGNVGSALDHQDVGGLVQPAQPGSAGGAACHSTDDDDLHDGIPRKKDRPLLGRTSSKLP